MYTCSYSKMHYLLRLISQVLFETLNSADQVGNVVCKLYIKDNNHLPAGIS